ncbi:endonuclease domain-containing protein [Lentzea sp. NBRC 105346]|uniref:endonuclease domain-containing protein n=1 Tax=Lentzea sp. NBRC 105346 TaxID=3032205 RepID=UPI0033230301
MYEHLFGSQGIRPAQGRETPRCTRSRSNGQSCKARAISRTWILDVDDRPAPQSCAAHLTAEERDVLEAGRARSQKAYDDAHRSPPACHEWPPPVPGQTVAQWQAGRCAICGVPGGSVVDHCHRTGLFRGFLCTGCNTREGLRCELIFRLYRERPPAVILGQTHQYVGYGYSFDNGAEPQQWVRDELGPVPDDPAAAAEYLAAAARLADPRVGWDYGFTLGLDDEADHEEERDLWPC